MIVQSSSCYFSTEFAFKGLFFCIMNYQMCFETRFVREFL